MKIVAAEPIGITSVQAEQIRNQFLSLKHEFIYYSDRREDVSSLIERIHEADIVIISNIPLNENVLSQCKNLKMLSIAFTGLDHIDLDYCKKHNIMVCNASGYATTAVCELTIGLILDVYRHITFLDAQTRKLQTRNNFPGRQIAGKTVGILGTGAIGKSVALALQKLGCHIVTWNRSQNQELIDSKIPYLPLEELLRISDIISIHLPLTKETFHLLDKSKLELCKNDAILINTARGNIVDMQVLANMLVNGKLAGAGIDVFETEPPLPENHPLLKVPNCVIVPHIGYATQEAFKHRIEIVLDNIFQWMQNKK
jgi:D-3-phosphoglycerate dehydrogenase